MPEIPEADGAGRPSPVAGAGAFPPGRSLCIELGGARFNLRGAAVPLRDEHVLVHRRVGDPFWALPGGRVELGETAGAAVLRELQEELGLEARLGPLRFVVESFFAYDGQAFHEIGFYYAVTLPESFPFLSDGSVCHRAVDGGPLEFAWVPAGPAALAAIDFRPAVLRDRLLALSARPVHLSSDEFAPPNDGA